MSSSPLGAGSKSVLGHNGSSSIGVAIIISAIELHLLLLVQDERCDFSALTVSLVVLDQFVIAAFATAFAFFYEGDDLVLADPSSLIPRWIVTVGSYFVGIACICVEDNSIFCNLILVVAAPKDQDLMRVERDNKVIKTTSMVR